MWGTEASERIVLFTSFKGEGAKHDVLWNAASKRTTSQAIPEQETTELKDETKSL